jgi:hypothetical protein
VSAPGTVYAFDQGGIPGWMKDGWQLDANQDFDSYNNGYTLQYYATSTIYTISKPSVGIPPFKLIPKDTGKHAAVCPQCGGQLIAWTEMQTSPVSGEGPTVSPISTQLIFRLVESHWTQQCGQPVGSMHWDSSVPGHGPVFKTW